MSQPCQFREGGTAKEPKLCGKICDAGMTLCPRHHALHMAQLEREIERNRRPQRPKRKSGAR